MLVLNDFDGHAGNRTRPVQTQQFANHGVGVIDVPFDAHLRSGLVIDVDKVMTFNNLALIRQDRQGDTAAEPGPAVGKKRCYIQEGPRTYRRRLYSGTSRCGRVRSHHMVIRHNNIGKVVVTAVAAAVLGLMTANSATADSTDEAFLRRLAADGLMFSTTTAVVERAQVVCEAFSTGMSTADVHETMLHSSAMTPRQMALFMAAAVQAYCPTYAGDLFS